MVACFAAATTSVYAHVASRYGRQTLARHRSRREAHQYLLGAGLEHIFAFSSIFVRISPFTRTSYFLFTGRNATRCYYIYISVSCRVDGTPFLSYTGRCEICQRLSSFLHYARRSYRSFRLYVAIQRETFGISCERPPPCAVSSMPRYQS